MSLSVRDKDAELARLAAQVWTDAFLQFDQNRVKLAVDAACSQLDERLKDLKKQRKNIERQYSSFIDNATDNQTIVVKEAHFKQLQNNYNELKLQYHENKLKLVEAIAVAKKYRQQWADETDPSGRWVGILPPDLPNQSSQPSSIQPGATPVLLAGDNASAAEPDNHADQVRNAAEQLQKYRRLIRQYITSKDVVSAEVAGRAAAPRIHHKVVPGQGVAGEPDYCGTGPGVRPEPAAGQPESEPGTCAELPGGEADKVRRFRITALLPGLRIPFPESRHSVEVRRDPRGRQVRKTPVERRAGIGEPQARVVAVEVNRAGADREFDMPGPAREPFVRGRRPRDA